MTSNIVADIRLLTLSLLIELLGKTLSQTELSKVATVALCLSDKTFRTGPCNIYVRANQRLVSTIEQAPIDVKGGIGLAGVVDKQADVLTVLLNCRIGVGYATANGQTQNQKQDKISHCSHLSTYMLP